MKTLFRRGFAIAVLALAGTTSALAADPFPSKPVRIVVTSAAGGFLDQVARVVAQHMGAKLGQQVIVENRVGAGGLVAIRSVKAAPADGYTLMATVNTVAIQQAMSLDAGYDLTKDFTGVGPINRSPFLLMAPTSLPDKNVSEVLARARANPGQVNYASGGNGTTTHFSAAMMSQMAGVSMLHVPYKGNSAAWPDLIAGRVGMLMEPYGSAVPMMREGRLKALGVTSTKRIEILPEVPTIAEQGVPNYKYYLWVGLLAPAGTPKDVLQKLSEALRAALTSAELQKRFRDEGSEAMLMPPDEFTQFLKEEVDAMNKLVSDLKLPKQ